MTLATKITLLRIILMPIFIVLLLQGHHPWPAVIFTFTIVTDALDGFIARWKKQKTALGSFLDPLADKLLMFSSFLTLAYLKVIPLWIFVVIVSRDMLIVIGWLVFYFITHSIEIKPRLSGKLTAIIQMTTVWLILLGLAGQWKEGFLVLTVIITSASALDYVIVGSKNLSGASPPVRR
ncbi:MAG: CDP-alcohol phosphatidyltransferase family protein [Elusimicrobiota bacterium]